MWLWSLRYFERLDKLHLDEYLSGVNMSCSIAFEVIIKLLSFLVPNHQLDVDVLFFIVCRSFFKVQIIY